MAVSSTNTTSNSVSSPSGVAISSIKFNANPSQSNTGSASNNSPTISASSSKQLGTGAIAGITIGALLFIIISIVIVACMIRRKRSIKASPALSSIAKLETAEVDTNPPPGREDSSPGDNTVNAKEETNYSFTPPMVINKINSTNILPWERLNSLIWKSSRGHSILPEASPAVATLDLFMEEIPVLSSDQSSITAAVINMRSTAEAASKGYLPKKSLSVRISQNPEQQLVIPVVKSSASNMTTTVENSATATSLKNPARNSTTVEVIVERVNSIRYASSRHYCTSVDVETNCDEQSMILSPTETLESPLSTISAAESESTIVLINTPSPLKHNPIMAFDLKTMSVASAFGQ